MGSSKSGFHSCHVSVATGLPSAFIGGFWGGQRSKFNRMSSAHISSESRQILHSLFHGLLLSEQLSVNSYCTPPILSVKKGEFFFCFNSSTLRVWKLFPPSPRQLSVKSYDAFFCLLSSATTQSLHLIDPHS